MKTIKRLLCCLICCLMCCLVACGSADNEDYNESDDATKPTEHEDENFEVVIKKPNIYLYGYNEDVTITLGKDIEERLLCTYPRYNEGWNVKAEPNGLLKDKEGRTYQYLFWEGIPNHDYKLREGFCVKGEETASFLENKLAILGLNDKEIDDFITYWLPDMEKNAWNIISFKTDEYEEYTPLTVNPAPEDKVRVLMIWYPWNTKLTITEQTLTPKQIDRTKKTLVEWGGVKVANFENH